MLNILAGSFFLRVHEDELPLLALAPLFDLYQGVLLGGAWFIAAWTSSGAPRCAGDDVPRHAAACNAGAISEVLGDAAVVRSVACLPSSARLDALRLQAVGHARVRALAPRPSIRRTASVRTARPVVALACLVFSEESCGTSRHGPHVGSVWGLHIVAIGRSCQRSRWRSECRHPAQHRRQPAGTEPGRARPEVQI